MAERVASPVFVGRRTELAALGAALAQPQRTAAVLVGGEAGAGKSRLVAEFTAAAAGAGARVLAGACVALGAESLPFAPFMGVLGQLAAEVGPDGVEALVGPGRVDLARLVPELRRPGDDARPAAAAERAVLFQVVLRTLEALGAQAPLVVVVEDLHWADASSRELLSFLFGRLGGRVLMVATYRNDEVHRRHPLRPFLAEAARSDRVARLELAPLTAEEVARQLEAIAGSTLPPAIVQAVVGRAEGNPFFAEELLAAGGGDDLPPDLAEVLAARLAGLPPAAQELVRVAAVAGRRVSHDLLAAAVAASQADVGQGLRDAISHNVLVADPARAYAFRHALLAEAAYAELLPAERATLHAAYAAALTAHPEWATTAAGSAGELAHHYLAAGNAARALEASVTAADAASETSAFAEAHALYEQALGLWDQVPDAPEVAGCDRVRLLERAADAAVLAGATPRDIALVRSALEIDAVSQAARAALLYWRLARILWKRGEGTASLAAHRTAVSLVPAEPSAERALILAGEGQVLMLDGRYQESAIRCEEAIAVARAAGARREEGHARNTLGISLSRMADHERAVRLLEESLAIAEEVGSVEDVWRAYMNLATALDVAEELGRAATVTREGAARLDCLGYDGGAATLRGAQAMVLLTMGAWSEADRLAAEALAGAHLEMNTMTAHEVRGTVAQRRGDFASAHAHLREARRMCSASYPGFLAEVLAAMAELALAEGRIDDSRALVDEGLQAVGIEAEAEVLTLVSLGLRGEGDSAGRKGGRQGSQDRPQEARAEHLAERARALSADLAGRGIPTTRRSQVLHAHCDAELGRALGCSDPQLWATAADAWTQISHPYEATYARWRQGEAHLSTGAKAEGVTALREAFAGASALGAEPLVAEIEALARRARVRLPSATTPDAPPPERSHGLTERESEVLALLAAGHTNHEIAEALFMSDKTASVHVSRILTKLGVANRGQAAALAHRLRLVEERSAR